MTASPSLISATDHIRRERMVSILINMILSLLFFLAVFHGVDPVPVWGMGNFAFDFIPQSFMIGLMATFVPGLLTARKCRAGGVERLSIRSRLPESVSLRSLLLALLSTLIGAGLVAAILTLTGVTSMGWDSALAIKIAYGSLLGAIVTPIAVRSALANH